MFLKVKMFSYSYLLQLISEKVQMFAPKPNNISKQPDGRNKKKIRPHCSLIRKKKVTNKIKQVLVEEYVDQSYYQVMACSHSSLKHQNKTCFLKIINFITSFNNGYCFLRYCTVVRLLP